MGEFLLVLTLYCGVPVAVTVSYPTEEGRKTLVGPLSTAEHRKFWLEEAAKRDPLGQVKRIKVEEQVEGIRCPVAS